MKSSSSRFVLPWSLAIGLVVLRLTVGWHFYSEGTKKLDYDPHTGKTVVAFQGTEGFLKGATGPLADFFHGLAPTFHDSEALLAVPRQAGPLSEEEAQQLAEWNAAVTAFQRGGDGAEAAEPPKIPPVGPYSAWASKIIEDWRDLLRRFNRLEGLSEKQMAAAVDAFESRRQQLADYLAHEGDAIAEWQHELWRLDNLQRAPEATGVPFQQERIAEKQAETRSQGASWVAQVQGIQRGLVQDLRSTLNAEQLDSAAMLDRVDAALADPAEARVARMNQGVAYLITGIGVLLMLGLFTRLASVAGIAFLVSVIATQPPWVAGANTQVFGYQLAEIGALIVLFASAAGRIAGLDFFLHRALAKCCGGGRESAGRKPMVAYG